MKKVALAATAVVVAGGVYYYMTQMAPQKDEIALPEISKAELNNLVASQAADYKTNGFLLAEKEGKFTLTAQDEKKVRQFLVNKLSSMLPASYNSAMEQLKSNLLTGDEKFLEGMAFDMKVVESDAGAQLQVSLSRLSNIIEAEMAKDPEAFKEIRSFIEKGGMTYTLSMDNKGTINGIAVQDINETFHPTPSRTFSFKSEGIWAKFQGDINKIFKMQEGVKKISFDAEIPGEKISFTLNDLTGKLHQTTPLDQTSDSAIGKILFHMIQGDKNIELQLQNIAVEADSKSDKGFVGSGFEMRSGINSFIVTQGGIEQNRFGLDNLRLNLHADHITQEAVMALQDLGMSGNPDQDMQKLQKALTDMVHAGLKFDINAVNTDKFTLNAAGGALNLDINNFKFELHMELKENALDLNAGSPMQIIPFLQAKGKLQLNAKDLEKLVQMQPMLGMLNAMKKVDGESAVFEFAFLNGQTTINGNPLPF